jgi:hypothetical protein
MHLRARVLWAPKAGNRSDEYEDAFWPHRTVNRAINRTVNRSGRRGGSFRFAVADGATETSFSGLWARRLVRAYGEGCFARSDWLAALHREQAAWSAEVLQKPLPWYAEEKARSGAFAALLGCEIASAGTWSSWAIGDCCLLQWRAGQLVAAFPAAGTAFFTSRPFLVPSSSAHNAALAEHVQRAAGEWQPGDRFALLSDALGQWVWRELEAGRPPWAPLEQRHADGQMPLFAQWLADLRTAGELRNDDVTAVLVAVE